MAEPKRLPEIRVTLTRVPPGERAVPLEYPANLGLRTKFGGEPDWIQWTSDTPECGSCGQAMTFVAQLDSFEHRNERNPLSRSPSGHQDYMFGDVGMIYVFFCFDCLVPHCLHECY
jgi:hypothetical protein